MTRTIRNVALGALSWAIFTPQVSADPILVTSGVLTAPLPPPNGSVSLVGTQGFSLEARVTVGEGNVHPLNECDRCLPGLELSVGGILSGAAFVGVATLNGTTYTDFSSVDSPASLYFEFFGSTVAPAFQDAPISITAPFSFRGIFSVPFPDQPVMLTGGGLATLLFKPAIFVEGESRRWMVESVRYDFGDQTPVPEPGTLLMVGSGLLAFARAAKRARRGDLGNPT